MYQITMRRSLLLIAVAGLLGLTSCQSNKADHQAVVPTGAIREQLNQTATLPLADEFESAEYIPLKATDDDASLIEGVLDYAITSKYIYILVDKEARIVQFDRQGNFIRTFIQQGQGPNDFNGMIGFIQANEEANRFYVYGHKIGVYTLDGQFVKDITIKSPNIFGRHVGNDRVAAVAAPLMTFQSGSFGLGVFAENGEAVVTKNNFESPLVPKKNAGFTFGIIASPSDDERSVLFKMASNDTIFRLSADTIQPALVARLGNSDKEEIRGLNTKELKPTAADGDIFVTDIFETPRRFYLRMLLDQKYHVASVDKKTGETVVERCSTPEMDGMGLADINIQLGMVGTKSHKQFPIWGRPSGNHLVQVVTPYEIEVYEEAIKMTTPQELQDKDTNDNPILVLYKMK